MKKKSYSKKQGITLATRGIVYMMGFAVFAVCAILLPELAREERQANPNAGSALPFLIGAWILSIPIFTALYETLKILNYIDEDSAFSKLTVNAIQKIKMCAIIFAALIFLSALSTIVIGKNIDPSEDFAPVASIGLMFTFASGIVATFAAVLQRILQDALDMKSENDLII